MVKTSDPELDITAFEVVHSEAGASLVFHYLHANVDLMVVSVHGMKESEKSWCYC